ncbi:MAG: S-methyl-5'-thioadenosine phosphorylase [Anaerolineales bacterium]|nr:S-methyl-5'-thioadenosine phosphorylase [Anaerolineales bacterium]
MNQKPQINLGVIGGSGLYKMEQLDNIQRIEINTPFGQPSSPIMVGTLDGFPIGFIARHGLNHQITPTEVNYRANLYALKAIGAEKVLGISACGSLREDFTPGLLVVPDQLVDFTKKRKNSYFEDGLVVHISVAEPFCYDFSSQVYDAATVAGAPIKRGGSAITIEGPRFSTKAESQLFRSWGIDLIGMTTSPEAFLAREAELCYTTLFHVTDFDVWHQTEEPVSVEQVLKIIQQNTANAQTVVRQLVQDFRHTRQCQCAFALESSFITSPKNLSQENKDKYALLIDHYLDS